MKRNPNLYFSLLIIIPFFFKTVSCQNTELWISGNHTIVSDTNGIAMDSIFSLPYTDVTRPRYTKFIEGNNGLLYAAGSSFEYNVFQQLIIIYNPKSHVIRDVKVADGKYATGSVIQASDGKIYGLTSEGGQNNVGVIFSYDILSDSASIVYEFSQNNIGNTPYGDMVEVSNKLYGTTSDGGVGNKGCLFEYDMVTGSMLKKIDFNDSLGSNPSGTLTKASNGKLYGTTSNGGVYNHGTLFEYDISTNSISQKYSFSVTSGYKAFYNYMILASNGLLYGMLNEGGVYGEGVIFSYDPQNEIYSKLFDFNSAVNGGKPVGGLTESSNGLLYGLTPKVSSQNEGILFEFNLATNNLVVKHIFVGDNYSGYNPQSSLIQVDNGVFYGMATNGGSVADGVLFSFDVTNNKYVPEYTFGDFFNNYASISNFMQASNGYVYVQAYNSLKKNASILKINPVTKELKNIETLDTFDITNSMYINDITESTKENKLMLIAGVYPKQHIIEYNIKNDKAVVAYSLDTLGVMPYLCKLNSGQLCGFYYRYMGYTKIIGLYSYNVVNQNFTPLYEFPDSIGSLIDDSPIYLDNATNSIIGMARGGTFYHAYLFKFDLDTKKYSTLYNPEARAFLGWKHIDNQSTLHFFTVKEDFISLDYDSVYYNTINLQNDSITTKLISKLGTNYYNSPWSHLKDMLYPSENKVLLLTQGYTGLPHIHEYDIKKDTFIDKNSFNYSSTPFNKFDQILLSPYFIKQPDSVSKCPNDSVVFRTNAIGAQNFQWYKDSVIVSGATDSTLHINNISSINQGQYYCKAYNEVSNNNTRNAFLDVKQAPNSLGEDTTICYQQTVFLDAGMGYDSYQWNTKAESRTFLVDSTNSHLGYNYYYVTASGINKCTMRDSIVIFVSSCLPENYLKFKIYPNPVSSILNIESKGIVKEEIDIRITNILGKVVYQGVLEANESIHSINILPMNNMRNSTYILELSNSKGVIKRMKILVIP